MSAAESTTVGIRQWIEKASLRLAECEAESHRLDLGEKSARRLKLEARSRRYQGLVDYLREKSTTDRTASSTDEKDPLVSLEESLHELRTRILKAAVSLVRDKVRLRELKTSWGIAVDEYLSRREAEGRPRGPTPSLDFTFPPPPPGATDDEREAHRVLRSIGL